VKRTSVFVVVLVMAVVFAATSCGTGPAAAQPAAAPDRPIGGFVPDFVRNAVRTAPEDALVGIGTARLATISMSRTLAQTRARADISRQLNTIVRDMVTDYMATAETDPQAALSFQEVITVAISESRLQGASTVDEDMMADGQYWVVVMLSRSNAAQEIASASESASRLQPGFDHAMRAIDRMNTAFDSQARAPIPVADSD